MTPDHQAHLFPKDHAQTLIDTMNAEDDEWSYIYEEAGSYARIVVYDDEGYRMGAL